MNCQLFRANCLAFRAKRTAFRAKGLKHFEQSTKELFETFHHISFGTFLVYLLLQNCRHRLTPALC